MMKKGSCMKRQRIVKKILMEIKAVKELRVKMRNSNKL